VVNPLLSSLFNLRAHLNSPKCVAIVIDAATRITPAEYLRCLRPWTPRVSVAAAVEIDRPSLPAALSSLPWQDIDASVAVTGDPDFARAVQQVTDRCQKLAVDSRVAADGSRELALFQEVLHHDYELGGFNEWTSGDSQFGASVLRSISLTHCRLRYPQYMDARLQALRANVSRPVEALDIGCGALSRLRWGALQGLMTVTGVDPLLDMYAVVRERHGLNTLPHVACARDVIAPAELVHRQLPAASIDFAYCANALDHTENPVSVIESLATVIRPGGFLAIEVFTREGSREQWWQLHQFDMYMDERKGFVAETRDGVVRDIFPSGSGFAVTDVVVNNRDTTCLVAERLQ
jgi:SAM-dependent methyltransferase